MQKHYLSVPHHAINLLKIRSGIYRKIDEFDIEYVQSKEPIPFDKLSEYTFEPYRIGTKWGDRFDCAWFRLTAKIPDEQGHLVGIINNGGEGAVYTSDGTIVQGITIVQGVSDVLQTRIGKQIVDLAPFAENGKFVLYVDSGNNKFLRSLYLLGTPHKNDIAKLKVADVVVLRDDMLGLYYDYLTAYEIAMSIDRTDDDFRSAVKVLNAAVRLAAKGEFSPETVAEARENLVKLQRDMKERNPLSVYCVGHAHLDLAWLWPIRETKRKAVRTLANAFLNLEKFDGFVMGISQPQMISWMEREYPQIFDRFKYYVEKDRIELQGAMWIESDCNMNSGESLVRQFLYGKKYWREKFGKEVRTCWLPDAFGFNGQMPQIMKKNGVDYFYTIKISWNTVNKFPYQSFVWKGIDGSEVLTHMSPEGNYTSSGSPLAIAKAIRNYRQKDVSPLFLVTYGPGDGGGGPGEFSLEVMSRLTTLSNYHVVRQSKAIDFFQELRHYAKDLPVYRGELYLEKHQGTYTSQAKVKAYNRRAEFALHNVEFLSTLAKCLTGEPHDGAEFEEIWHEVLLYQFHDILPGSSIGRVYEECGARYEAIFLRLAEIEKQKLAAISPETAAIPVAVNCNPVYIGGYVKHGDAWYRADCPAYSAKPLAPYDEKAFMRCDEHVMENDVIRLQFDDKGVIISMIDKTDQRQYCGEFLNKLLLYTDREMYYNAWDIDPNYIDKVRDQPRLKNVQVYIDGPTIIRRQEFTYLKSIIIQNVILTAHDKMVKFDTMVDWKETVTMLRAEFAPSIYNEQIQCDEQFGYLKRRTTNNNKIESAQFEICAHKYVNLDSTDCGIALINNCKYGLRAKEGKISLNLLRSPTYPDRKCDRGEHYFSYALYPHAEKLDESDVYARSVAFNNPLRISENAVEFDSVVTSNNDRIIIDGIKPREDGGDGMVLRLFNNSESEQTCDLSISLPYTALVETDMQERETYAEISSTGVTFTPFEIKTIVVK